MDSLSRISWKNHNNNFSASLVTFRESGKFSDTKLYTVDCKSPLHSHKLVLSSCSEYFSTIIDNADPNIPLAIVLSSVSRHQLELLLDFMYKGECEVTSEELPELVKVAESLKIKGLLVSEEKSAQGPHPILPELPIHPSIIPPRMAQNPYLLNNFGSDVTNAFLSSLSRFTSAPISQLQNNTLTTVTSSYNLENTSPPLTKKRRLSSPVENHREVKKEVLQNGHAEDDRQSPRNLEIKVEMDTEANNGLLDTNQENSQKSTNGNSSSVQEFLHAEMSVHNHRGLSELLQPCTTDSDSDDGEIEPKLLINDEEQEDGDTAEGAPTIQQILANNTQMAKNLQKTNIILENYPSSTDPEFKSLPKDIQSRITKRERKLHIENMQEISMVIDEEGNSVQFKCRVCEAKLGNQNLLARHCYDLHDGMRRYGCDVCEKRFKRKEHMERHRRTHTGEKPYQCHICFTRFTQKEHMKGHIKNTHIKKEGKGKTVTRKPRKIAAKKLNRIEESPVNGHISPIILNEGVQNGTSPSIVHGPPPSSAFNPVPLLNLTKAISEQNQAINLNMLAGAAASVPENQTSSPESSESRPSSIPDLTPAVSLATSNSLYSPSNNFVNILHAFPPSSTSHLSLFNSQNNPNHFLNSLIRSTNSLNSTPTHSTAVSQLATRGRGGKRGRKARNSPPIQRMSYENASAPTSTSSSLDIPALATEAGNAQVSAMFSSLSRREGAAVTQKHVTEMALKM